MHTGQIVLMVDICHRSDVHKHFLCFFAYFESFIRLCGLTSFFKQCIELFIREECTVTRDAHHFWMEQWIHAIISITGYSGPAKDEHIMVALCSPFEVRTPLKLFNIHIDVDFFERFLEIYRSIYTLLLIVCPEID